jgi:YHS domain-containing protein
MLSPAYHTGLVRAPTLLVPVNEKEGKTMATDPVCGMEVKEDQAAATAEHDGMKYYFCSQGCHDEFVKNPEQYTKGGSSTGS